MKILVINAGSSSIKYKLFDMNHNRVLASGLAEKIGEKTGTLTHEVFDEKGKAQKMENRGEITNHRDGLTRIANSLTHEKYGVIRDKTEIAAVGHRVVHGGETFQSTTIIDEGVIHAIQKHVPLAPLHNPPNLIGIDVALSVFPFAPQVAVFDTAFHQTIPEKAFLYAIPFELYKNEGIRRYGFHGTSHSYVAEMFAEYAKKPLGELNLITIHLGNGASMAALKKGKCVDTSMGLTPLEGLVMGTRCGDTDPAIPFFLSDHLNMTLKEIDDILNKESGLKGICGLNDMREILKRKDAGDERAALAIDIYCYRIKKYIGAYFAVLGSLDGIIFTAGIGENAPLIREACCMGLEAMGIEIDSDKNFSCKKGPAEIGAKGRGLKIMVIPTNEELKIARETKKIIETRVI